MVLDLAGAAGLIRGYLMAMPIESSNRSRPLFCHYFCTAQGSLIFGHFLKTELNTLPENEVYSPVSVHPANKNTF